MIIQPLWQAPQHADRVIDRIWAAFGTGLSRAFFASVVEHSQQGFSHLHLYAAFRDYYERFGWEYIGEGIDYPDTRVNLYRYTL